MRAPRRSALRRRAALPAGLALVAGLAGATTAAADDAGSVTHSAGAVAATMEWDKADYGIANPRLYVVRDGVRYDLTIIDICAEGCIVAPDGGADPATSAVKVADLDGDGEPEVLVDTFSGGAHCCLTARVLTFNGTGYTPTDVAYGDVGYALKDADGDGRPELVGYDPRFSSVFTAFAGSAFPPQVLQIDKGTTVDVTRRFPNLVRTDAQRRLRDVRGARRSDDIRGLLAAYVADQYLLGRGTVGTTEVDRQRRAGRVSKGFKKELLRRLKGWKYR
ncbi:MAG: hypothetical protein JWR30_514 [Conexibacter sp.]|nr:hypothetical protein [Conexibacter sp.]